jgi:tetratricopeptide (TPR) repeat protein
VAEEWDDPDNAILILQTAIKSFPDSWEAYDAMGETYISKGDTALAIQCYRESLEMNPNGEEAKKMIKQFVGK